MIYNSGQFQNTTISNGEISYANDYSAKDSKRTIFYLIIFLYLFFGKWNIFTIFRVSTDYLFWAILFVFFAVCLFLVRKV